MQQGLAAAAVARGSEVALPEMLALLVGAYARSEQPDEGVGVLANALTMVKDNEERLLESELYRLKGELLLLRGDPETNVEANFQQAIEIARRQGARSLELRAATSLARLWNSQGKQEDACQLLAPIYGWFSEGFDTLDLIEAKALLDELS
jgi:predicted ATPase